MKKILIIEDEQNLARFIELELKHEDYEVEICYDGESGLNQALTDDYDCILLDLMLPKMNGLEVCRRIRREKNTPIIMITAKGDTYDKVIGLDYGADDYIVKPFDIEELLARIRVIIRRNVTLESDTSTIEINDIKIDKNAFSVYIGGESVDLTKTEYELLLLLAENQNYVLQREQILNHVWGYESEVETNVVDVYIRYLRNKLKPFKKENIIETVRGVGYVIRS
ncbi:two-component system response regulator [Mammaliicoccus lentus]|jgi:two-component system response regulator ArlR|uniref:Response regulator ArlR n=1 Tax=Mammaliicoccus lentus TaxID=42858 RepID=A0AAX3W7N6_MAMLE|nr:MULTISPECIES: response regulator transcription factor [Mammaliicoccus]HBV03913.1 DNA-binding response regulator [Staphylococcus sp.]MBF0747776.1 response regulator transcription factor [Mammaliicoccus lentus]MBF0793128.1 response regulator transcription factor [Mammaliicoccus lentus]MBW0763313.1 response regulator transcription factor [Mammaliicoccus lentus]MBW0767725.1 response regulator transcription factor [Mammaliicoccus lentus]